MQARGVSEGKTSNIAKLVQVALEDGSAYNISMKNTWNPNCFHKENVALKEKFETRSAKEENKEVVEINYFPTSGKPKKSRKLRFSAEGKRNILDGKMLTGEFPNIAGFMDTFCVKHNDLI